MHTRFNLGPETAHDSSLYSESSLINENIHGWIRPPSLHLPVNGDSRPGLHMTRVPVFRAALLSRPASFLVAGNAPDEPPQSVAGFLAGMDHLPTLDVLTFGVFWRMRHEGIDEALTALSSPATQDGKYLLALSEAAAYRTFGMLSLCTGDSPVFHPAPQCCRSNRRDRSLGDTAVHWKLKEKSRW